MTTLLLAALALLFAFTIYLAVLSGRASQAVQFLDAGRGLPAWAFIFGATGVLLGSLGLHDHFLLTARYGLPYSQVALGFILAAVCAALLQQRFWLASR